MTSPVTEVSQEKPNIITEGLPSYKEAVKMSGSDNFKTRRWLIVAVTAAILLIVAVGGALLGVYLQNKHVKSLVQEVTMNTKEGKERIRVDPENGEEEVELPERKFLVLYDFNKGLTVFRLSMSGSPACYLQPLNQTGLMPPKELAEYLKKGRHSQRGSKNETKTISYELTIGNVKVKDISFLSDRARAMCDGLPAYWLIPGDRKTGHRQKRGCLTLSVRILFVRIRIRWCG